MSPTQSPSPGVPGPIPARRRRLRAVFAADVANFGGMVTIDETKTLDGLWLTRKVATEELEIHGGWLFGLPGDGIFALFESTVDAVRCALRIQSRLAESPKLYALKLRIGVHLGEVLFQDELPFGEALVIAARLESLAEPGGILVSASVMEAVASRIMATFVEAGVPTLKHSPRRIETFRVLPPPPTGAAAGALDRTVASQPARATELLRPDVADAPSLARMPRAAPLVVPDAPPAEAEPPPAVAAVSAPALAAPPPPPHAPMAVTAGLDEASLGQLAQVLTPHLGPVAKLLVRRTAAENPDPAQLLRILAQEIPVESERVKFLMRARALLAGSP